MSCCTADEGGPLEVGLLGQASNRVELRRLNGWGGERRRNGATKIASGVIAKANASEPLMTCRKVYRRHRNRGVWLTRDEAQRMPADWLGGVRHEGGASAIEAVVRNVGTCRPDAKGAVQVGSPDEDLSTDAGRRGGAVRSSDEVVERRWSEGAASSGLARGSTSNGRSS